MTSATADTTVAAAGTQKCSDQPSESVTVGAPQPKMS